MVVLQAAAAAEYVVDAGFLKAFYPLHRRDIQRQGACGVWEQEHLLFHRAGNAGGVEGSVA